MVCKRLVTVGLRKRDKVLETPWLGLVEAVDSAQGEVTLRFGLGNDAEGEKISHFRK